MYLIPSSLFDQSYDIVQVSDVGPEHLVMFNHLLDPKNEHLFNFDDMYVNLIQYSTVDVQNVSLIPSDNPFTIREGTQRIVRCVVNQNAVPPPTITWYLESTDITIADTDNTNFTITGNKADNTKILQCRAANNNKPEKTASTTLNVECKCLFGNN